MSLKPVNLARTTEKQPLPPTFLSKCQSIWGANKKFSLEITTEEQIENPPRYIAVLRWDRGGEGKGPVLLDTMKHGCEEEAKKELEVLAERFLEAKKRVAAKAC